MRPITEIVLANLATNANNAGVSTAFPNLTTLDGWKVI